MKDNIHQHIVTTASDLFYVNGYHATGVNAIIEKAGIAKATLYHHFKSKEDICIAHLKFRHEAFMEELQTFLNKSSSSTQKLLGIFDVLRDLYRKGDFYGCWAQRILAELSPDHRKVFAVIQHQKKELLSVLSNLVKDSFAFISKAETEKIAGGLYLLYESAITESHLHKNDWPIHLGKQVASNLFLNVKLKQ